MRLPCNMSINLSSELNLVYLDWIGFALHIFLSTDGTWSLQTSVGGEFGD